MEFSQTGIDSSAGSNTVLTVGSTNYAYNALPNSVYVDDGTTFSWVSPVSGGTGKQFVQTGSSGSSPISATGTYTVSFQLQYYFGVSSARDTPTGQGWYNAGSSVSSTVTRPVSGGMGIQYETTGWTRYG